MSDIQSVIKLEVPTFLLETIKEDYSISNMSLDEFNNLIKLSLWESYIQNSLISSSIQKTNGDFLVSKYIHQNFENDLIDIYKSLKNIIEEGNKEDYKVSENIVITSENFEKTIKLILNILVANNISYIKYILTNVIKIQKKGEQYSEALDLGVASFTKSLLKFDTSKGFKITTYCEFDLIGEMRTVYKKNDFFNVSDELKKINKFLKSFVENKEEYIYLNSSELLGMLLGSIKKLDKKDVINFGKSYFYLLGFGEITVKDFCSKYGIEEDIDIPSFFRNDNNVDIFIQNIINYIIENKDSDYLPKRIVKISTDLSILEDGGLVSLDSKLKEDSDTTLLETLNCDNGIGHIETSIYQKDNIDIWNREIRYIKIYNGKKEELDPNIDWTYLERIIAGTCINEYLTFKEFRDMLIEYGKIKGEGNKFADNFHVYLGLFKFKDKTNWYQYDNRVLDALTFEQMGDILGFSKNYAIKVYQKLKDKFDDFYGPHIVFTKYDTGYHGPTKTFRNLKKKEKTEDEMSEKEKLDTLKQEYVPEINLKNSYKAKKK